MGQTYTKKQGFKFTPLQYSFHDVMSECNNMKYICTMIGKSEMPRTTGNLPFELSGFPDEIALTGCTEAPECQGIAARDIEWSLELLGMAIAGQATSVGLSSTVFFRENNTEISGQGLWRMGIFGSRDAGGSGERFSYVSQTLSEEQQAKTLIENTPLNLTNVETLFEIGSVGCNDFGFICVEFTGGDGPNPYYFFRKEGAVDASRSANTITKCKEQECLSKAIFSDLEVDLGDQVLNENKNNHLTVDITGITTNDSKNVMGGNLWMLGVYGSRNPFGSGPKTGFIEQALNPTAAATTLSEGENLSLGEIGFDFDMTRIDCSEAFYLCFDLDKNPQATVNYVFDSLPDESVTTTCVDMSSKCKGATAVDFDWILDVDEGKFGKPTPLSMDVEIHFTPESPAVTGQGLWKLSAFASMNENGTGVRMDEIVQTLDSYNQAMTLQEGGPLEFYGIQVPFPIGELSCDGYGWFCLEFQQGERPRPEFMFETEGDGESIISCKKHSCKGSTIYLFVKYCYISWPPANPMPNDEYD
nr:uncharacterized protein LOC129255586 [Lytechinus pictus]